MDIGESMSFKISRKSSMASFLESSISTKLRRLISNYTDDVLAEYITLLVCNGKDQYQATEDLEAFLGDKTTEFVSWLWDLLLKNAREYNEQIHFSYSKHANVDKAKDKRIRRRSESSTGEGVSQMRRKGMLTKVRAVEEKKRNFLAIESPVKGSPILGLIKHMDKINKIVSSNRNGKANEHLQLPNKELGPRNSESSSLERPPFRQIYAANEGISVLPLSSIGGKTQQTEKHRVSVWDRLGKPSDDGSASQSAFDVGEHGEVLGHSIGELPISVGKVGRRIPKEIHTWGDKLYGEKSQILEHSVNNMSKLHIASNIGRKRHFGDLSVKKDSKVIKKPNLKPEDLKANLHVSELAVVKKRLRDVQMEMVKLRSKQMEMGKEGKPILLSHTGALNLADIESRTVFVKNVHFAASGEALSSHFSKCGVIENVVILADKATGQLKGSAYVTFIDKESVDRAVALSGTAFFSRTLKVFRNVETSTVTTAAVNSYQTPSYQLGRTVGPNRPYHTRTLQWRRESDPVTGETSTPSIAEVNKEVKAFSAEKQLVSGSLSPVKTNESPLQMPDLTIAA